GACAWLAIHCDSAAMTTDYIFGITKAEAVTFGVMRVAGWNSKEFFKYAFAVFGWNSDSVVADNEDNVVALLGYVNSNDRIFLRVLHGVVDKVEDHAEEMVPVAFHFYIA